MKTSEPNLDDLFRDALEGHQMTPSRSARDAFLRDASMLQADRKGSSKRRIITGVLLLSAALVLITGWIYLQLPDVEVSDRVSVTAIPPVNGSHVGTRSGNLKQTENGKAEVPGTFISGTPGSVNSKKNFAAAGKADLPHHNKALKPAQAGTRPGLKQPVTVLPTSDIQTNPEAEMSPVSENIANIIDPESPETLTLSSEKTEKEHLTDAGTSASGVISSDSANALQLKIDSTLSDSEFSGKKPVHPVRQRESRFTAGISFTPEWMFNTLEGTKFIRNFGLEGIFHYGPFSIRTGAGISTGKGTNELLVEYNDYLGTYNKLDSMDISWDYSAKAYKKTVYTSVRDVYDSLIKIDQYKIVKRYTYLQIPLVFGYDLVNTGIISVGARIGPVMSVLLDEKQLSADYDAGKNRIVRINDISPGQVSLNWQILAGVGVGIRLRKNLSIDLEPEFRYYFNSVYEKPANQAKPWSTGIRAGVMFNF